MIEEKIFSALERIHTACRSSLQQSVSENGVSSLQAQIMLFLQQRETASVSQLAEHLKLSKPTVSDAVAALSEKKLIKKSFSESDARGYLIILTTKGKQEIAKISGYAAPFLESLGTLTDGQKQALWDALLNLLRTMESQGLISRQRMCFSCMHLGQNINSHTYYCKLMQAPLSIPALRIDCDEHERRTA